MCVCVYIYTDIVVWYLHMDYVAFEGMFVCLLASN